MKKNYTLLLLCSTCIGLFAQTDFSAKILVNDFNTENEKLYKKVFFEDYQSSDQKVWQNIKFYFNDINYKEVNVMANPLKEIIYQSEKMNQFGESVTDLTRQLICSIHEPYIINLLKRAITNDTNKFDPISNTRNDMFKLKLIKEAEKHEYLLLANKYPYFHYETRNKKHINFFRIATGNDLFALTTKNLDRDYTGSLTIELGTDFLKFLRRRPVKSYQTILYGFDVFTPSFYDTLKFKNFNDFDTLDRPHAAFNYFGWKQCSQSLNDKFRWTFAIKFGQIGDRIGEKFQTALHQDISYSLRPKGWDAQIARGGRIGVSIEAKQEYQFYLDELLKLKPAKILPINLSPFLESKVGTYMTNASFGIQLSNKRFTENNPHFINHRTRQGINYWTQHFMYNIAFKGTYVLHNSMLEGYGIFNTTESKSDPLTPKSIYYLKYNQVNRFIYTGNFTMSYTTSFATIFYNWFIFSPETKLSKLNSKDERIKGIDIGKRWHHFAEIGLSFNVR
jgi:Uncharacterized protein conserved in bacteria (DUF2219)